MDKELIEKIMKNFNDNNGFVSYNNIVIDELKEGYAKLHVDLTKDALNPSNMAHGGLIFGLADTAMGTVAYTTGRKAITVNAQIDYLKQCKGKRITAVAEPLKVGRNIAVYRAHVYTDEDVLSATVTGTFCFTTDLQ